MEIFPLTGRSGRRAVSVKCRKMAVLVDLCRTNFVDICLV